MRRFMLVATVLALAVMVLLFYKTEEALVPKAPIAEFGGVSLRIEYATTTVARERGLGGRENIPNGYGMLFVFPKASKCGFWMKDMLAPIDIFWLDDKGHVVSFAENVATSSYPNVFYPTEPVRYVLETVAGFANKHAVATGTPLLLKIFPIVSE